MLNRELYCIISYKNQNDYLSHLWKKKLFAQNKKSKGESPILFPDEESGTETV